MAKPLNPNHLITIFDELFEAKYNTVLRRSDGEPLYLPATDERRPHQVLFAHGFFSSALHETAHWCIAGVERRKLLDYGYWYRPDGRSPSEQQEFERAEVKPQALEWIFSVASGCHFHASIDNLSGASTDSESFRRRIRAQSLTYLQGGLPGRAEQFSTALTRFYGRNEAFADFWQRVARDQLMIPD